MKKCKTITENEKIRVLILHLFYEQKEKNCINDKMIIIITIIQ